MHRHCVDQYSDLFQYNSLRAGCCWAGGLHARFCHAFLVRRIYLWCCRMRRWVRSWRRRKLSYNNWRTVEIRYLGRLYLLHFYHQTTAFVANASTKEIIGLINTLLERLWLIRSQANHSLIFWNCYRPNCRPGRAVGRLHVCLSTW